MALFKKFFKNIIHDRVPKDDYLKGKFSGTVTPYPHFDANSDVTILHAAIENDNVGEDVIVSVLVNRSNEQRQMIKVVYEAVHGEKLEEELHSVLSSDLDKVTQALLKRPAYYDAHLLRKATKGLGTDEDILVEVLATRSNHEIQDIKLAYHQEYETELEEVIKDETHGDFKTALLALLKASKDESLEADMALAKKDAEALMEAAANADEADIAAVIDILTSRGAHQLYKTLEHYAQVNGVSLEDALDIELDEDIEECLIDVAKMVWNMPAFFAEKLQKAMEGPCEDTVVRILVSRSEVDLRNILEEYKAMYNASLKEDIVKEIEGHHRAVLLGLCGPH